MRFLTHKTYFYLFSSFTSCLSWVQMGETMRLMETFLLKQMSWHMIVLLGKVFS